MRKWKGTDGLAKRLGCITVASILVVGSCHAHRNSAKKGTMTMMSKSKGYFDNGGIEVATDSYPHDEGDYYESEEAGTGIIDDNQYHKKGGYASKRQRRKSCASSTKQSKGRSKSVTKGGDSRDYYRHNVFDRNHRRQLHLKSNKEDSEDCVISVSKGSKSISAVKSAKAKRNATSKGRDKSRSKGNGTRRSKGSMGLRTRYPTFAPAEGEVTDDTFFPFFNVTEVPTSINVRPDGTQMPDTTTSPPTEEPTTIGTAAPTDAPEPMERLDYVRFDVQIDDATTDFFIVEVHPEWAPIGAKRFLDLVKLDEPTVPAPFFNEQRFFRVIEDFIVQWGISGDPEVAEEWARMTVVDDAVIESNVAGTLTFAQTNVPNSRSTQVFINYVDNSFLDESGFAPFGRLYSDRDMEVAMRLYSGYGEGPPEGDGPDQFRLTEEGNDYLEAEFPLLSYIISAERLEGPPPATLRSQLDRRNFRPSGGFFTRAISSQSALAAASATTMAVSAFCLFFAIKFRRNKVSQSNGLLKGPIL